MKIKLYHGTSLQALEHIKKNGMPSGTYLTSDLDQASYYAEVVSEEHESLPVIIVAEVNTQSLKADRPSFDEPLSYFMDKLNVSEEQWHEMITNDEIPYPKSEDWIISLQYTNSVKTTAAIAVHDIDWSEGVCLTVKEEEAINNLIYPKKKLKP